MPFNHSVKVPRTYKLAASILKQVSEGCSLKSLLFQEKYRFWPVNTIYALTLETLKNEAILNKLFAELNIFENEPRLEPWLAKVLMVEILFGKKKLPHGSKPVESILPYCNKAKELLSQLKIDVEDNDNRVWKPRYVRVNTLKIAIADAIRAFQDSGWKFIRCTARSYNDYLEQLKNLTPDDFIQDYHVKTVFAFAPKTQLQEEQMFVERNILLQDKATCLAATLLAPTPGSTIVDMCAAPGMKTTNLAALIKNDGKIYAVEKDIERFEILCKFIEETGATCVKPINEDAFKLNNEMCPDAEYVLVDPSCSGSGMARPEFRADSKDSLYGRLEKLSSMQAKLLKHALIAFPKAKRVVYSTCSIYPEENEAVIQEIAAHRIVKRRFQLISAKKVLKDEWNNVGNKYRVGKNCLYAIPDSDFTTGVFVAVFERIIPDVFENKEMDLENVKVAHIAHKADNKEICHEIQDEGVSMQDKINENFEDTVSEFKKKHKKKKQKLINENTVSHLSNNDNNSCDVILVESMRPKKSKHSKDEVFHEINNTLNALGNETEMDFENVEVSHIAHNANDKEICHEIQDEGVSMQDKIINENFEDTVSELKKKHKKKKQKLINENSISHLSNDDNNSCDVILVESMRPKKSKHSKDEVFHEINNMLNVLGNETEMELEMKPKHQKRKKSNLQDEKVFENSEDNNSEDIKMKQHTLKNKSNISYVSNGGDIVESCDVLLLNTVKKHKISKRSKDELSSEIDNPHSVQENGTVMEKETKSKFTRNNKDEFVSNDMVQDERIIKYSENTISQSEKKCKDRKQKFDNNSNISHLSNDGNVESRGVLLSGTVRHKKQQKDPKTEVFSGIDNVYYVKENIMEMEEETKMKRKKKKKYRFLSDDKVCLQGEEIYEYPEDPVPRLGKKFRNKKSELYNNNNMSYLYNNGDNVESHDLLSIETVKLKKFKHSKDKVLNETYNLNSTQGSEETEKTTEYKSNKRKKNKLNSDNVCTQDIINEHILILDSDSEKTTEYKSNKRKKNKCNSDNVCTQDIINEHILILDSDSEKTSKSRKKNPKLGLSNDTNEYSVFLENDLANEIKEIKRKRKK